MDFTTPHFLLSSRIDCEKGSGQWHFVLRTEDGCSQFEAMDAEPGLSGERLDLLTVVRALESLDQPSRVTLLDCSDYILKGVHMASLSGGATVGGGSSSGKWFR